MTKGSLQKKKKNIREIFHHWGGESKIKNFTVFKVMFKIHFRPFSHFGKKNLGEKRGGGGDSYALYRE